jgi:hypothetical protein
MRCLSGLQDLSLRAESMLRYELQEKIVIKAAMCTKQVPGRILVSQKTQILSRVYLSSKYPINAVKMNRSGTSAVHYVPVPAVPKPKTKTSVAGRRLSSALSISPR